MTIPTSGLVYVDANIAIYTVEKHPRYGGLLRPFWSSVDAGGACAITSELTLLETLVGPYKAGLADLAADYEAFLALGGIQLIPISPSVLREAAKLRASMTSLRAPDAIHAATALLHGAAHLLTNDPVFQSVSGLQVCCLDAIVEDRDGK